GGEGLHPAALRRTAGHRAVIDRPHSAFLVPGQAGQTTEATFTLIRREAHLLNELGLFVVDDASGRIGAHHPGDRGCAAAALARRVKLFDRGQEQGATARVLLHGGAFFGTYLIQDATAERFLSRNADERPGRRPVAFFSFAAAN